MDLRIGRAIVVRKRSSVPLRSEPLRGVKLAAKGSSALMILVTTEIGQEDEEMEISEEAYLVESWTPRFRQ